MPQYKHTINEKTTITGLGISYENVNNAISIGHGFPQIQLHNTTLDSHMDLSNSSIEISDTTGKLAITTAGLDICGTTHVSLDALSTLSGLSGRLEAENAALKSRMDAIELAIIGLQNN